MNKSHQFSFAVFVSCVMITALMLIIGRSFQIITVKRAGDDAVLWQDAEFEDAVLNQKYAQEDLTIVMNHWLQLEALKDEDVPNEQLDAKCNALKLKIEELERNNDAAKFRVLELMQRMK